MRACSTPLQRRLLLCALILSATFAFSLASSQAAHAWTNYYCSGAAVDPKTWCTDDSFHTYFTNKAEYRGGGSVWVCGNLRRRSGAVELSHCAFNISFASMTDSGLATRALIYNGSPTRHTMYGEANA